MKMKAIPTLAALCILTLTLTGPARAADSLDIALVGGRVYPSPTASPIENAVALIHDGKILIVARATPAQTIPKSARVIDCSGKIIVAGFWNSHVHLTEDVWNNA